MSARATGREIRVGLPLAGAELGEEVYRRENAAFRDAGRPLTEIRDARVLLDHRPIYQWIIEPAFSLRGAYGQS